MSTMEPIISDPGAVSGDPLGGENLGVGDRVYGFLRAIPTWLLWLLVLIWSLPTLGLFINGFRTRDAQRNSGWWRVVPDELTFANYNEVFTADAGLGKSLLNSMAIAVPATIIPIAIAAFAAYGFAWIDFRGRKWLFIATVALLAVPLQVALIPLLRLWNYGAHWTIPGIDKTITLIPDFSLVNTTTAVWLTHTGFAMPFAIFLLHNYISSLPKDVFEAARIDGADHFTIFWRLVLPLSIPVLASFTIFQLPLGVERLPRRIGVPRGNTGGPGDHTGAGRTERYARRGVAPADVRCVHHHGAAAGGVLLAPAVLRQRSDGRLRQGLRQLDGERGHCEADVARAYVRLRGLRHQHDRGGGRRGSPAAPRTVSRQGDCSLWDWPSRPSRSWCWHTDRNTDVPRQRPYWRCSCRWLVAVLMLRLFGPGHRPTGSGRPGTPSGATIALRFESARHSRVGRWIAVALVTLYVFVLLRTVQEAGIFAGPLLPMFAVGVADIFAERQRDRRT